MSEINEFTPEKSDSNRITTTGELSQDDFDFELTSNPLLDKLINGIATTTIDTNYLTKLTNRFKTTPTYTKWNQRFLKDPRSHLTRVHSYVFEELLTMRLEELAGEGVVLNTIQPGEPPTEHFRFESVTDDSGNIVVFNLVDNVRVAEYDAIALITSPGIPPLPVSFDGKFMNPASTSSRFATDLQPSKVNRRCMPLAERFGTKQFGYVFVGVQGVRNNRSPAQRQFEEHGGIIVEVPISYKEFNGFINQTLLAKP